MCLEMYLDSFITYTYSWTTALLNIPFPCPKNLNGLLKGNFIKRLHKPLWKSYTNLNSLLELYFKLDNGQYNLQNCMTYHLNSTAEVYVCAV